MHSLISLLNYILIGEFGLLTMTPRYLFGVLFPVMVLLGFLSGILAKIPYFQKGETNLFFYITAGLGCTTAALAALDSIEVEQTRRYITWLLVVLIPCSSQIAIMAAFATLVTMRVFLTYIGLVVFYSTLFYLLLTKLVPPEKNLTSLPVAIPVLHPWQIIKEAFYSVTSTIPSFCAGSIIISVLNFCRTLDGISRIFSPWLEGFLHLPKEAASLFLLNLFKRDFGSASLLAFAEGGAFDAVQMVVVMMMLTFCVPCFNSTVLLFKQEKLPIAAFLWLGSFFISILIGRVTFTILFVCTV